MSLWTRSVEEILKKQDGKNVLGHRKIFWYFLNFLRRERSSGMEFWQASRGWKDAQPKFFDQKSVKFEGSMMLRYGVINDWNIKFLQAIIENFSIISKIFYYRVIFRNFFTYPVSICQALALTPKRKNLKFFLIFLF